MNDRNAEREAERRRLAATAKPGRLIVLGAVAMAFGALFAVRILGGYVTLAGQSPEMDTVELRALRTPEMQLAMWVALVESVFLLAAGIGLVQLRRWARSLFFALAITRVCVLAWRAWYFGVAGSPLGFALSLLTLFFFGFGVWILTRPGAHEVLAPRED